MKNFIKREWPAFIASLLFTSALTCAVLTVINNWDYVSTTFIH